MRTWVPVLLSILPAGLSLLVGATAAIDFVLFLVTLLWLFYVLKKPEDLFQAATLRRAQLASQSQPLHSQRSSAADASWATPPATPVSRSAQRGSLSSSSSSSSPSSVPRRSSGDNAEAAGIIAGRIPTSAAAAPGGSAPALAGLGAQQTVGPSSAGTHLPRGVFAETSSSSSSAAAAAANHHGARKAAAASSNATKDAAEAGDVIATVSDAQRHKLRTRAGYVAASSNLTVVSEEKQQTKSSSSSLQEHKVFEQASSSIRRTVRVQDGATNATGSDSMIQEEMLERQRSRNPALSYATYDPTDSDDLLDDDETGAPVAVTEARRNLLEQTSKLKVTLQPPRSSSVGNIDSSDKEADDDETHREYIEAMAELRGLERRALVTSLIAPFVGAIGIHLLGSQSEGVLMALFSPRLFLVASGLPPFLRLWNTWTSRAHELQQQLDRPLIEAEAMAEREDRLNTQVHTLEHELASVQGELVALKSRVDSSLLKMTRVLRNSKGAIDMHTEASTQRLVSLETRLAESESLLKFGATSLSPTEVTWLSLFRWERPSVKAARLLMLLFRR